MESDPHTRFCESFCVFRARPCLDIVIRCSQGVNSLGSQKQQAQKRRCGLLMSPLLLLLAVRATLRQVPPDSLDSLAAINGLCWRKHSVCADLCYPSQQFPSFDFNLFSASSVFPIYLDFNMETLDFKHENLFSTTSRLWQLFFFNEIDFFSWLLEINWILTVEIDFFCVIAEKRHILTLFSVALSWFTVFVWFFRFVATETKYWPTATVWNWSDQPLWMKQKKEGTCYIFIRHMILFYS